MRYTFHSLRLLPAAFSLIDPFPLIYLRSRYLWSVPPIPDSHWRERERKKGAITSYAYYTWNRQWSNSLYSLPFSIKWMALCASHWGGEKGYLFLEYFVGRQKGSLFRVAKSRGGWIVLLFWFTNFSLCEFISILVIFLAWWESAFSPIPPILYERENKSFQLKVNTSQTFKREIYNVVHLHPQSGRVW